VAKRLVTYCRKLGGTRELREADYLKTAFGLGYEARTKKVEGSFVTLVTVRNGGEHRLRGAWAEEDAEKAVAVLKRLSNSLEAEYPGGSCKHYKRVWRKW